MEPVFSVKVMLIITLTFPNYHIYEYIPFDSNAACEVVVKQQQKPDNDLFHFNIIVEGNNRNTDADNATPKPIIESKCKTVTVAK
jgi:hypothetical protein